MHSPLISIITINYNQASGLRATIESVLQQECTLLEFIIIDGGSADESVAVLHEFDAAIDVWISEPDQGIYDAMNKGLAKAAGTYILFLNSGDILADANILKGVSFLLLQNPVDILYGDTWIVDHQYNILYKRSHAKFGPIQFVVAGINHQSYFSKRDLYAKFGNFDCTYTLKADHEWLLRILTRLEDIKMLYVDKIIAKYLIGGFSQQHKKASFAQVENNRMLAAYTNRCIYNLYRLTQKIFLLRKSAFLRNFINDYLLRKSYEFKTG